MRIRRLVVRGVRVLREVELRPGMGLNLIGGRNGSGKTSILEAIQILGTGHSFRSGEAEGVIERGASRLQVFGELEREDGGTCRIGIEREQRGGGEVHIDGAAGKTVMEAARELPLLAMTAGSERVVEGGPSERRRLIDWGVFHVEHDFGRRWREARRILAQRNAALKARATEAELREWDALWVSASEGLEAVRASYVTELNEELAKLIGEAGLPAAMSDCSLKYRSGWGEAEASTDRLREERSRELSAGGTLFGFHRSELAIATGGQPARYRLSRGQQKGLVFAIRLAQVRHLLRVRGLRAVLLIDDLGAELDAESVRWVLTHYGKLDLQGFVTGVDAEHYPGEGWRESRLFHVEQGVVREVV